MHSDIVLGFDFGLKWVGVAVGNRVTNSANPLKQLPAKAGELNWHEVSQLIKEWQPGVLVVGVPLKVDGTAFYVTEQAKQFISELKEKTKLPVYGVDERMTSVEARQSLFNELGYKGLTKANIDSMAAKLITEQWMSEH